MLRIFSFFILFLSIIIFLGCNVKKNNSSQNIATKEIIDCNKRKVNVPEQISRIICSGPGALRLICYLNSVDKVVAVDDIEKKKSWFNTKPYSLANPELSKLPLFGEFRGHDNPELIVSLPEIPQIILKTYINSGYNPVELQKKTGIPVVTLEYGDLTGNREFLFKSLRLIGKVINKEKRAEDCIEYFISSIRDLNSRTKHIQNFKSPKCYIGGIAYKGAHGILSTEPGYAPFLFLATNNLAYAASDGKLQKRHMIVAKEKLIEWDPDYIFIDLATTQMTGKGNALSQLKTDPSLSILKAVKSQKIYFVLPYNSYTINFGSVLANAYFIGKILYPEYFKDIDPAAKADEIYKFLVGKAVYKELDSMFKNRTFKGL